MLFRILLVDDEPHVVKAISELLYSLKDPTLDIYSAYSGLEAMEILKQGKIDLLVTDIKMPEISGLQLADEILKLNPKCKIVYLTAYPSFDFAYQAFKQSASNYLLKSEGDQQILAKLTEVIQELKKKYLEWIPFTLSEETMNFSLLPLFQTEVPVSEKNNTLKDLGFSSLSNLFLMLAQPHGDSLDEKELLLLKSKLAACLTSFASQCLKHFVLDLENGTIVGIFSLNEELDIKASLLWFSGFLENIQAYFMKNENIAFSFLYSNTLSGVKDFPNTFHIAREYQTKLKSEPGFHIFHFVCNEKTSEEKSNEILNQNTIQFICKYIEEHIHEDISLITLSSLTGYNASYLSWFFHKQTGALLNQYISQKKMELIDKLMLNSSLSIEDICSQCGFRSRSYFNYFVKQKTGQAPKAYRSSILRS